MISSAALRCRSQLAGALASLSIAAIAIHVATPAAHAQFFDATANSGIAYVHAPSGSAVQKGHGGLAAVDVDGDGWTDIIGARFNASPVLYINQHDGTFREEAAQRGLSVATNAGAFAAGDFSNKGSSDLFVVPEKGKRFYLFINDGTGHFTEQAIERGAAMSTTLEDHQAFSVSLVDYDRDGYLDVYVCEWGPTSGTEKTLHSVLLHNLGAKSPGHFENVTDAAGLTQPPVGKTQQTGFSAIWADFDADGWPDLYLVSDFGQSRMYWNNGNGTFTEGTVAAGLGKDEFGMGAAVADFDGDGRLDIFASSIYDRVMLATEGTNTGNKLYRNLGNRHFAEVSKAAGVDRTGWSWGSVFLDYDNDGAPDLLVTNGLDGVQGGPTLPYWDALTDPTTLFRNNGNGTFTNVGASLGIHDTGLGKGVVVADYDNDGRQDVFIADTYAGPIVYHNLTTVTGNKWIRLKFRGITSNRDGIGAQVRITTGSKTQTLLYNPTNAYLGSQEPFLHAGLGALSGTIDQIEIDWPSGIVQTLTNVTPNQVLAVTEPQIALKAPTIAQQPSVAGSFAKDVPLVLSVTATGNPAPTYLWQKNGVTITGANQPTFTLAHLAPFDAGAYHVVVTNSEGSVTSADVNVVVTIDLPSHSVARWWDEFLLDGIRKDTPNPPVHARNLYHLSAAMWDAYWAYEVEGWNSASPVFVKETLSSADWTSDRVAAQRQAISYAAYRVLMQRFAKSPGKDRTLFGFRWLMQQLGYDPDFTGTTGNSPAAVGNRIGYGVLAATTNDGANDANGYADLTGYKPKNDPLVVAQSGTAMIDPSRWQPLALKKSVTQNGIVIPESTQSFVGVNALITTPFALAKPTPSSLAIDPGPPPLFGTATHAAYVQEALDCIQMSAMLDPTDGVMIDISPGALLNNHLGTNDGIGHSVNPVTNQPYAANVVRRGDYARVLAEFWADGPSSETPPGHWNVIFNSVTDNPATTRRLGGTGPVLTPLAWDVRGYLALNGAVHDAACTAWGLKREYDSARPISVIRCLAGLGQSSDPSAASYNAQGLPLVPGLIELVTTASSAPGQRHAAFADSVGQIVIHAWQGNPADPKTQIGGVGWILAKDWVPYQLATFVTPAFPGYISGHSTFSRAAAEVLTLLTGSPYFPGGIASYHFTANQFLSFETGPTADLNLQWATYYDAADQAGLSRLFGGIHPSVDDFMGRRLGSRVGLGAFLRAQALRRDVNSVRGLTNISARGRSGSGEAAMIAGFVIGGDTTQTTLIRCVGPELQKYGIAAAVCETDPKLELHRVGVDGVMLTNDNWSSSQQAAAIATRAAGVGAFPLSSGSADAAAVADLAPGGYTTVMGSAAPDKRGIVLAEVYGQHLINLSTRGSVGAGDNVLIAGFVIDSPEPLPVLIRGIGPTLTNYGVQTALANPVLTVYQLQADGTFKVVAKNDNWSEDIAASLANDAAMQTGAFLLPAGSKDAALFLELPAGTYSAIVSSADSTEGVAMAEVYHVK